MSVVVTLEDFRPAPRYDGNAWTQAQIDEAATSDGTWATIDTVNLDPVDADPANPAYRSFTTDNGTGPDLWYRITFIDALANEGLPSYPVQNISITRPVYATVEELANLVRVRSADRHVSLLRVLASAAQEIDSEIGTVDINGTELPYGAPPAIVSEVNLERAVEHWNQMQNPFGVIGLGDMGAATYTARDSWDRHAHKLVVLKKDWGMA